jgi:hypothetical protein
LRAGHHLEFAAGEERAAPSRRCHAGAGRRNFPATYEFKVKTIVHVQLARDPVTQEVDRQAPFLVTDLKTKRTARCKSEPGVLAQIEPDGTEAFFEAEWDGERYAFGDRVSPPRR